MLAKQDSIRNIESKKSWDRFQKVFDAETKRIESTPFKGLSKFEENPNFVRNSYQSSNPFKITEIHHIRLNPKRNGNHLLRKGITTST